MRILVINPNSNESVLKRLEAAACSVTSPGDSVQAVCAASGIDLLVSEADQHRAAHAVADCAVDYSDEIDGIIIGSFGDTGIELVRDRVDVPVVGIARAAMQAAVSYGPKPAIISFSETMRSSFNSILKQYGLSDHGIKIHLLPEQHLPDPGQIAEVLHDALFELALSTARNGASCLVIGGGPLAGLAQSFRSAISIPIIDGTEEAVKLLKANSP